MIGRPGPVKRVRHRLAFALTLTCMVLAACGGEAGPATTISGNASTTSAPDRPTTTGGTSQASDWDALVDAANAEGELIVYTAQANSDVYFAEAFQAAYPNISVTATRIPTGDLVARLDQELAAGVAGTDVIYHAQLAWFLEHSDDGTLSPITVGPDVEDAYASFDGAMTIPLVRGPYGIAYNTELVQQAPETIEELYEIAAESGVTIGLTDPATSVGFMSQYQTWEDAYPGIWEQIAQLPTAVFASTSPMGQALAAGEIGLAAVEIASVIDPLVEEGAPVALVYPADDTVEGVDFTAAVAANAPHPNAAQLFINWLMTEEVHRWQVEEQSYATYLLPLGDLSHEAITIFDPAEWPPERQDEVVQWWHGIFGG